MGKGRLSFTVFTVLALAALAPALLFGFYILQTAGTALKEEQGQALALANAALSGDIDNFINKNTVLIETFLQTHGAQGGRNLNRADTDISAFVEGAAVSGLSFINKGGKETAYFGARPRMDNSEILPAVIETSIERREIFVGPVRKNPVRRQLFVKIAFPVKAGIFDAENSAVVAEFDLQPLGAAFKERAQKNDLDLIFTRSGFLIYSSDEGLSTAISDAYRQQIADLAPKAKTGEAVMIRGTGYSGMLTVNNKTDWLIYKERSDNTLKNITARAFKKSFITLAMVLGACFVFILALGSYLTGIIVRPVKIMTQAVNAVEAGEVNKLPSLPVSDNEVGVLAVAFARMLDSIKLKIEAMSQDRQDLEELNQSLELRVGSRTKELRTALSELIKKERLAAIGQMASIVSHEIKNPLAVMANAVYLIKARLGDNADPKMLKNISVIEQEIKQANGIIEEILGYARSREQILTVLDLNLYMKEILSSYPVPQNIQVTAEFAEQPLTVRIDSEEMKQAVRNIIANSIEVMPNGGQLIIKTRAEGKKAVLSIRDSGPGIPKKVQDNIFTPFFTTKARGTGLGLAVVKKVAGRNDADIILQSEEGRGTKISIIFKLYEGQQ